MGFFDRVHKIVTGVGGALQAPVGLVKDLATAPFTDDDVDGFAYTLYRSTVDRGGQLLGNLLGPDEGLGAAAGGLPAGVRNPAGSAIGATFRGLETVYREGIAEPITTALTVGSLTDAPGGGGVAGLFNPRHWSEAYEIAQDRSPGQAFALAVGTKDITNDAEVAEFAATDAYEIISGVADAALRLRVDPTILAGRAAGAARTKHVVRPLASADDVNRAVRSGRVSEVNTELGNIIRANPKGAATEIRHRFFPNHKQGPVISTVLAQEADDAVRMQALAAFMGHVPSLEALRAERAALAGKVARLQDDRAPLLLHGDDSLFTQPERVAQITAELDELYPQLQRTEWLDHLAGPLIAETPRLSRLAEARSNITRSQFYLESPLAAPLRVTFNMRPHWLLNLEDASGDVHVARLLRKSDLDIETQDALRAEYMAARNPNERMLAYQKAETESVRSIAEKAGMTVDEIDEVLTEAARLRGEAQAAATHSRVYSGDGKRSVLRVEDAEGWHEIHLPLWVTQETNFLPIVNLDRVRQATTQIGRFRARHPNFDIPQDLMTKFMKIWRPSVLLRGAWPMRVVGDEQLRIIAKIGALTHTKNLVRSAREFVKDMRGAPVLDDAGNFVLDEAGNPVFRPLPKGHRGQRAVKVRNYELEAAFGAPGDARNVYAELVEAQAAFRKVAGQTEDQLLREARKASGEWRTIAPTDPDYAKAWEHSVNLQVAQDPVGLRLLRGEPVDDIVRWLRSDAEGMAYAARNPVRRRDLQRWVETQAEEIHDLIPTPRLRELAAQRKASIDDLVREFPDATHRPNVSGEILSQVQGKGATAGLINRVVEGGFRFLGAHPTNVLSRNRFFDHMYRAEVERLVNILDDQLVKQGKRLQPDDLRRIEKQAREYALGETKHLLYDLAEASELGETLRNYVPFYQAFQEVLTRWAGLAVENPAFVMRMRQVWLSPERAGMVVDEKGNRVHSDGVWATNALGERVKAEGERYVTLSMAPAGVKQLLKAIPGTLVEEQARFNKESFNLALQGNPGFGPIVQVPTNEIVKHRPELEESLEFILPFGTTQSRRDLILPAAAKRLQTRAGGEDDLVYRNAMLRIYYDKWVDYNLGKRDTMPTFEEAKKDTNAFFNLRMAASYFSPAAPTFDSPYQTFINAYRVLREQDPETADQKFLDLYGEAYFPLTQSLSRSMDGVPPTLEGRAARKKYEDLVEKYPELGGLIVGAEGAGEFARAVYDSQIISDLAPGSALHQREPRSFEDAAGAPNVRLGWQRFRQAMDLIDAERIQRGLPNLSVAAARDLANLKRAFIEQLGEKYPEWYATFSVVDRNKMNRRIEAMRELVGDERLSQRSDIRGLGQYLRIRDTFSVELAKRAAGGGAKTLEATANQDLRLLWETLVGKLIEGPDGLAFGDLYHRYLERDLPEAA